MTRSAHALAAILLAGSLVVAAGTASGASPSALSAQPVGTAHGVVTLTGDHMEVTWPTRAGITTVTSLYEGDNRRGVTVSSTSVTVKRTIDARMFSVSTANGPYTIYVPATTDVGETDSAIGYAYSTEATLVGWNALVWPAGTEFLLDDVSLPVDVSLSTVGLSSDLAGSVIQLRQPFSEQILAFAGRIEEALPELATPEDPANITAEDLLALDAALLTAPADGPEVVYTSLIAIVPTPQAYVTPDDHVACADIPPGDEAGACTEDVTAASTQSTPAASTSLTTAAPLATNVIKTRPVMKSFIPEPVAEVYGGLCDNSKVYEAFQGDARGPGIDMPSARTTAFWDFSWGTDSGAFLRRISPTVRLASASFTGSIKTTDEEDTQDINTIQGVVGFHYLAGGTEGFRGVDLNVDSPNPFCSDLTALDINQDFGQTTATTFPYAGRAPFWEKDGSFATAFKHDAYPGHELYTYSYLPEARVNSGAPYFWVPTSKLGPLCLLANPFCPAIKGAFVNP